MTKITTREHTPSARERWFYPVIGSLMLVGSGFSQDLQQMADAVKAQSGGQRFMGSVLVAKGDQVVFEKSVGQANVEWNCPNSATTKFRIASLTKQFTAAAVLLLQERGKLQLDDPLTKYIEGAPAAWQSVSIRQLLAHSSGIPDTMDLPKKDNRDWELNGFTAAMLFDRMRGLPLDFEPGTKFKYSNTGYMLLGWIVERASGQSYRDFLKQNLFDPIEMKDTGYDSAIAIIPQRASGYNSGSLGIRNANYIDMRGPGAAGGLYSTTGDLLKWNHALFGGKVLQPQSVQLMTTPAKSDYAFGLRIQSKDGRKRFSHFGEINGFGSFLAYFPASDVTIVVLANVAGPSAAELEERLETIYFGK